MKKRQLTIRLGCLGSRTDYSSGESAGMMAMSFLNGSSGKLDFKWGDAGSGMSAEEYWARAMRLYELLEPGSKINPQISGEGEVNVNFMSGSGIDGDGGKNDTKTNDYRIAISPHKEYLGRTGGLMNGAIIDIWFTGNTNGYSKLNWIQNYWTTKSLGNDRNGVREPDGEGKPFYYSYSRINLEKQFSGSSDKETHFHDEPGRSSSYSNYSWEAEVSLVGYKGGQYHNIITFRWGFIIPAPNVIVPYWYQTSPSAEQLKSIKNAK